MQRNKAYFRLLRESVGLTQRQMAEEMGVDIRTVKRWENPDVPFSPPEDAWEFVLNAREAQLDAISSAFDIIDAAEEATGRRPNRVVLQYYRSQDSFDARHPGEGRYTMANASTRIVAAALEDNGIKIVVKYPEEYQIPRPEDGE